MKLNAPVERADGLLVRVGPEMEPGEWIVSPFGHLVRRSEADGVKERPAPIDAGRPCSLRR